MSLATPPTEGRAYEAIPVVAREVIDLTDDDGDSPLGLYDGEAPLLLLDQSSSSRGAVDLTQSPAASSAPSASSPGFLLPMPDWDLGLEESDEDEEEAAACTPAGLRLMGVDVHATSGVQLDCKGAARV